MKNIIISAALSAIVIFVWGFISSAVLPWQNMVTHEFKNEGDVATVLKENAYTEGVYRLPFSMENYQTGKTAAFVNVLPEGYKVGMSGMIISALIVNLIAALMVILLLHKTSDLNYIQRVGFVSLIGLVIGFVSGAPYWAWFEFPASYVLITILDTLIAWLLAGFVLAKFILGQQSIKEQIK